VNEVSISNLEQQVAGLTTLVRQLAVGNMQTVRACGICSVVGHQTDACPTLQEEPIEHVNAAGGFPRQPQGKYDPFSNSYNPGWRDHPNLSYGNSQGNQIVQNRSNFQQYRPSFPPRQQPAQSSNSGMNLEDIVKSLATNTLQFQQETYNSNKRQGQVFKKQGLVFRTWKDRWVNWQLQSTGWRHKTLETYHLKRSLILKRM